jgi:hypothetical protein
LSLYWQSFKVSEDSCERTTGLKLVSIFWEKDSLLIPFLGVVAIGRGGLVAGIGLLYVLFAVGALGGKNWAWWMGLIAALMNVFLVLSLVLQGAPVAQSLVWVIVPAILLYYLSNAQRHSLRFQNLEPH